MSEQDIIRAWKDATYRQSLSEDEQALVPAHPAGAIELDASELEQVNGGADQEVAFVSLSPPFVPVRWRDDRRLTARWEVVFMTTDPHCPSDTVRPDAHEVLSWVFCLLLRIELLWLLGMLRLSD